MAHDLAEHTATLLSLIGLLVSAVGGMVWRKLNTLEDKLDRNQAEHHQCREELHTKFVARDEFKDLRLELREWYKGRGELWDVINGHKHDKDGKVIR